MTLLIKTLAPRIGVKLLIALNIWIIFLLFSYNSVHKLWDITLDSDNLEFFGSSSFNIDVQIAAIESEHPSIPVRYWYDHKTNQHGGKTKNKKCATFPSITAIKYHNTYWQTFVKKNFTFQLYTAYYDTRPALRNGPRVRLLGMSKSKNFKNLTIYCQLWYEDTPQPDYIKITDFYMIWNRAWSQPWGLYFPYLFGCPLPKEHNVSHVPKVVSLVANKCQTATNSLRIHYDVPKYQNKTKYKFAVCIKGLDYPGKDISAKLVEWIELQFILGASKIFFYQLGLHPNVTKVLKYYQQRGLVDVRPTTIADGLPNLANLQSLLLKRSHAKKALNEVIPYNDCLYRNLYRYDYVAIQDIDEVLMPLENLTNWYDLIEYGLKQRSKLCLNDSFCFRNIYFSNVNRSNSSPFAPEIPHFLHILQHIERRTFHNPKLFNIKCLHSTAITITTHNHKGLKRLSPCNTYHFNVNVAQLQHYRERPYLNVTVNDTSVWRFKHKLLRRSLSVLRKLGFIGKMK